MDGRMNLNNRKHHRRRKSYIRMILFVLFLLVADGIVMYQIGKHYQSVDICIENAKDVLCKQNHVDNISLGQSLLKKEITEIKSEEVPVSEQQTDENIQGTELQISDVDTQVTNEETDDAICIDDERWVLLNEEDLLPQYPQNGDLRSLLEEIMPQILEGCTDTYEMVKACYVYLIETCSFSTTVKYDYEYDAYLLLTTHQGSCTYYAAAFHYMMLYIGLEDNIINGHRRVGETSSFHRWNELIINGVPYVFDAQVEDLLARKEGIKFERFFKTHEEVDDIYIWK